MQVGTGAFTGCSGLKELVIHQKKGLKSCAKEILGELWQKIDVDFLYENGEAGGKRAHMVFPEHYDEAVENTPARILFTEYHGSGPITGNASTAKNWISQSMTACLIWQW